MAKFGTLYVLLFGVIEFFKKPIIDRIVYDTEKTPAFDDFAYSLALSPSAGIYY